MLVLGTGYGLLGAYQMHCTHWDPTAVSGAVGLGWKTPLEVHRRGRAVSWLRSIERLEVEDSLLDVLASSMQRLMLMALCELSQLHFQGLSHWSRAWCGGACL